MWEAIHELPEIDYGFAIVCDGTQVVIGDDFVWDVGYCDLHVVVVLKWRVQINIFYVGRHVP